MNLHRLRELAKAWQDGSIREAELLELRDALPKVFERFEKLEIPKTRRALPNTDCMHDILLVLQRCKPIDGLIVSELFGRVKGSGSLGYARFRASLDKLVVEGAHVRKAKIGNYWRYRVVVRP